MIKEHLEYWYDKDGNKVYGDKKKFNKCLVYLMDNDPKKVMSKTGLEIRKKINPLFRKLVNLFASSKLIIETETKKNDLPKDRPIIFASTHGFRDDIVSAIKAAGVHGYVLYGSLPDFYYSIDGIALWLNGVIIVDRKDKESRHAAIKKMEHLIDLGGNIIMFPEGVWDKSKNLPCLKLFPGIYKVAKEKNAIIVPIVSIQENNKTYIKRLPAFDITKYDEKKGREILRAILALDKMDLMIIMN